MCCSLQAKEKLYQRKMLISRGTSSLQINFLVKLGGAALSVGSRRR
jgi:hypothetical protein